MEAQNMLAVTANARSRNFMEVPLKVGKWIDGVQNLWLSAQPNALEIGGLTLHNQKGQR